MSAVDGGTGGDEDDIPWAWLKAFHDIVRADPPPDVPDPPVAVLPWLYLAPLFRVRGNASQLEALGITHVLSTNRMPPQISESLYWELRSADIDQYYFAADDLLSYDMMAHWNECRAYLQECLDQDGKALVHCSAGMNRSGTMAAAAMMEFGNMTLLDVARTLKAKRGYVMSNASFVKQLVRWAGEKGYLGEKPEGYSDDAVEV